MPASLNVLTGLHPFCFILFNVLYQPYSAVYVVQVTSAKFDLHAGNMKLIHKMDEINTQNGA